MPAVFVQFLRDFGILRIIFKEDHEGHRGYTKDTEDFLKNLCFVSFREPDSSWQFYFTTINEGLQYLYRVFGILRIIFKENHEGHRGYTKDTEDFLKNLCFVSFREPYSLE